MLIIAVLAVIGCGGSSDPSEPDARVVMLQCDPEAQDCPAEQKCNPLGALAPWEGTTCVADNAATGSPPDTPCFTGPDSTDTCDAESMCLQLGTGEGVCTAFCTDAPADTCDPDERCILYDEALGLKLCGVRCELDTPDCPRFYKCIDALAGPTCVPVTLQDFVPHA